MTTNETITAFDGVRVGLHTDRDAATGCLVAVFDRPNVAAAEIRGAAPGGREIGLLGPGMTVQRIDAIALTGGSAYGLAAADGVMGALRDDERGYETKFGRVPIVPAAVVYDLGAGDPNVFPTAADGAGAYRAATSDPVPNGAVGPGTGCTVSKWRGEPQPGGLGNGFASVDGVAVAAVAVVNATGDLFDVDGRPLTGGPTRPDGPATMAYGENTTLVLVVVDAPMTRADLSRVLVRAHDAMGACIRPAHTRYDGDVCFAVSLHPDDGAPEPAPDPFLVDRAGEAAFGAVADAIAASLPVS